MRHWMPAAVALVAFPLNASFANDIPRPDGPVASTPAMYEVADASRIQAADPAASPASSYACALAGSSAAGLTAFFGADTLLSGIIVAPVAPALLTAGLAGVAFVAFCNVGQILAPAAVDIADRFGPAGRNAPEPAAAPTEPRSRRLESPLPRPAQLLDPAMRLRRDGFEAAQVGCAKYDGCNRLMSALGLAPTPRGLPAIGDTAEPSFANNAR
jgi:hypothetical protein